MTRTPDRENLKIPPALHREIKMEAAKEGKKMYALVEEMWEARKRGYPASKQRDAPQNTSGGQGKTTERGDTLESLLERHPHGKQLQRVIYILDSGVEDAIAALQSNILSFFIRARRERGETDEASYRALLAEVRSGGAAASGAEHRARPRKGNTRG